MKVEKENRILGIRPYINEYMGELKHVIEYNAYIFEDGSFEYKNEDKILVKIKNIGLGPMIAFKIKSLNGEPVYHADVKSLEKDGIMRLDIYYKFKELYIRATYEVLVEYSDILANQYSQIITIYTLRNENGDHIEAEIAEIGQPKF